MFSADKDDVFCQVARGYTVVEGDERAKAVAAMVVAGRGRAAE